MTAGQFWDEDPWLAEAYREAAEYQAQRKSWEMWLQGVYVCNAVSTALGLSLIHIFYTWLELRIQCAFHSPVEFLLWFLPLTFPPFCNIL